MVEVFLDQGRSIFVDDETGRMVKGRLADGAPFAVFDVRDTEGYNWTLVAGHISAIRYGRRSQ